MDPHVVMSCIKNHNEHGDSLSIKSQNFLSTGAFVVNIFLGAGGEDHMMKR